MANPRSTSPVRGFAGFLRDARIAIGVLAVVLLVSAWAAFEIGRHDAAAARLQRERHLGEQAITLTERMRAYEQALLAATGLFLRDGSVSRAQWQAFNRHIGFTRRNPGVLALGYAPVLSGLEVDAFEAAQRADGVAGFSVHPRPPAHRLSAPVMYLDPSTPANLPVLGFDLLSEPVRRSAAMRALDSGAPVLSARVTLRQDMASGIPGVILFAPVYRADVARAQRADRRGALQGWAYLAFRTGDFIDAAIAHEEDAAGIRLYAGEQAEAAQLLYGDAPAYAAREQISLGLDVPGGRWLLVAPAAAPSGAPLWRALTVAVSGAALGVALSLLTLFLTRTRAHALAQVRSREEELQRSHQFLNAIVNAIPLPVFVKDAEHRWILLNDAQCAVHGRAREELLGKPDAALYPPEWVARNYEQDDRALASGQPLFFEERLMSLRDDPRWVLKAKAGVTLPDGSRYVVGITTDITERRSAEQALERERTLLRATLNASPAAIYIKDAQHRYLLCNAAAAQPFGIEPDAFVGSSDFDHFTPDTAQRLLEQDREVLCDGIPRETEDRLVTRDGREIWVLEHKSRCRLPDGSDVLVGSSLDITRRKVVALEIAATRSLLERVLDAIPVSVALKDEQHRFVLLNQAWGSLHALSTQEMLGRTDVDVHGPELGAQRQAEDDWVLRTGEVLASETPYVDAAGRERFGIRRKQVVQLADARPGVLVTYFELTERRQMELELERSRRFLDALVAAVPVPLYVKDRLHRYVILNDAFARQFGVEDAAGFVGKCDRDLFLSEQVAQIWEEDDRAFAARERVVSEQRLVTQAGHTAWVLKNKAALRLPNGEEYLLGASIDITTQKRAEEESRHARALLDAVIDAVPVVVSVKDEDGRIVLINRACEAMHGEPASFFIGRTDADLYSPEMAARIRAEDLRALGGEELALYDVPFEGIGGTKQWVSKRKRAFAFPDGRRGVLVILYDTTPLHDALEEVTKARGFLRAMLDALPTPVYVKDRAHRWVELNQAFQRLMNRPREELVGSTDRAVLPVETAQASYAEDDTAFASTRLVESEMYLAMPERPAQWFLKHKQAVTLPDGQQYVIAMAVDITARKRAEQELKRAEDELRRHRDRLQDLVLERTRELEAAKEAAERANRSKSEFLANMSHELRTPLHAILSFARLGVDRVGHVPAPVQKFEQYFSRIQQSGDRLLVLLNDLLDVAKLEAGKMTYDMGRCDVREVLRAALQELSALAGSRNVALVLEPYTCDPHAWCDAVRTGQVVRNLLSNAIKFSPAGGRVRLSLEDAGADDAPELLVSVCDDGPGIPEDELESIFDKFVQSTKTKSGAGGTGLGLAICQRIVLDHGGHVWAENLDGRGARFAFILPRAARAPRPVPDPAI